MNIPVSPWTLILETRFKVIPTVRSELKGWRRRAEEIPNPELRWQALASLAAKQFHCEGGSIYGLLAKRHWQEAIRFIVAYQTISDYLDNLCDRSTSLDPADFSALHESIANALTPGAKGKNYYRFRDEQNDGGYLQALVKTCQDVLRQIPNYGTIAPAVHELASYYCNLQVHKHVRIEERVPRLQMWFSAYQKQLPELRWYEFSACAGSTLGIFCLVAYGLDQELSNELTNRVKNSYFPWVQGFHILLDYLIDQEEDRVNGDLNFCFYYRNHEDMLERFKHFMQNAAESVSQLPHTGFHQLINQALLGVYLSDKKVRRQQEVQNIAKQLIHCSGSTASLFFRSRLLISH
ncbi:tetraprenyl-beta-curcumene synthase family protein [Leptolyngbya sp. FACHB-711]|uniref:tetraprenyl-beta-curcumene synthase family protein n=1 Tax=unclassified Leptolyngbya TaxID=2650499 RepID=UPI00168525C4|nr:tetraprenyl-beta-curcumene synthase family protein [Leptolyngbya sp. FACHB-711]MBD1849261.1 tetraprenyl-beta-curcumene synthase family protein [Cyanobacteria bacterium FACHB-502]MBD2027655.1 tetraprenyl-beta-curcumene synthase family protein [Leptolyngbya sp. FACHB-711]